MPTNSLRAGRTLLVLTTLSALPCFYAAAQTPPAGVRVLPQFIFGGGSPGWYSAIYLVNSGAMTAIVPMRFFYNNGLPMPVPLSAGFPATNPAVVIAPRGLAIVEATNSGLLSEGWAMIELPADVSGNGVFRLSVRDQPDQEAVVPLSSNTSKRVVIPFDDRDTMRTGVAVTNPTDGDINVTITARGEQGQTLGVRTMALAPQSKSTLFLNETAELAAMKGKRGTVEFTVPVGAVSVLGLRVRGLAFTSIPAVEQ